MLPVSLSLLGFFVGFVSLSVIPVLFLFLSVFLQLLFEYFCVSAFISFSKILLLCLCLSAFISLDQVSSFLCFWL